MVYPDRMATHRNKNNLAVDPKLRRKMLERWENEGGKVGDIDPRPPLAGDKSPKRKIHPEDYSGTRK